MFKIGKDGYRGHVESINHHFYINDAIVEADDYIDMIDCLYQSRPTDTIFIHLNTPGGDFNLAMQIINAVKASEATVVGIADGCVASAGSLILFACPNIAIQDFSYVMLHDGSEGFGGKVNENVKQAMFTASLLKKVCFDCYQPFFTEKEIQEVLDGKDMWLGSEEVTARIVATTNKDEEKEEEVED